MEAQSTENNFNPPTATRQRKTSRLTTQQRCRLLRLSPLICVIIGAILTVVGQTASIKICKIAGPVVMTFGGLLLAFITLCNSRWQDRSVSTEGTSFEQGVTTRESDERSNDQLPELGPIHHFEIWIPSESSSEEMVPPSYDEAVKNNNTESSQTNSAAANDDQELNLEHEMVRMPPLYEENAIDNNKESLQATSVVEIDEHGLRMNKLSSYTSSYEENREDITQNV